MLTRIGILVLAAVWLGAVLPAAEGQGGPAAAEGQAMEGVRGPLSAEDIRALVDGAPAEADLPGEDAVVLFDGTYIEYVRGLATLRRQRLVKVFTEWAIDHIGDPRLAFDGSRQELTVHASRTYLKNGSTVDTPDNGYNEVTPSSVALSRDHLNMREMVVTHVGLERGVSVLLDYSVADTSPLEFPFNRMFLLQDEFPALEKVIVMEGELQAEVVNPSMGLFDYHQPERDGDALTWRRKDVPARPRHQDHRLGDQVPWLAVASARMAFSNMLTWRPLLVVLGERVNQAVAETGELEAGIEVLEEDTPFLTEREALERIAEMVTERTALLKYDPWVFTPLPRSVSECLETSTATPVERAALMLACCRARHLEADLVLPARWESLSEEVPVLEVLGEPLVRVRARDLSTLWIDPVGGTVATRPDLTGGITYFVIRLEGAGTAEPVVAESISNAVKLDAFWDLEKGEGRAEVSIIGPVAGDLDWKEPETLVRSWAEGWCDSAEVTDLKILKSGPDGLKFTVELKAPLPEEDDRGRTMVDLPRSPMEMSAFLPDGMSLAQSRTDGLLFPDSPLSVELIWKVRPPEDLSLLPGPSVDVTWEDASLAVARTQAASLIETSYRLDWGGRPIIPEEYQGYRNLFLEATDPRLVRMVFAGEEEEE